MYFCSLLFWGLLGSSCANEESFSAVKDIGEGLIVPDPLARSSVEGEILWQHVGPKVTLTADSAHVYGLEEGSYGLKIFFDSLDSLSIYIERGEWDYNYHYPHDSLTNKLTTVLLNEDTLDLKESALSIQPFMEYNAFFTVINIHTLQVGDLNGTIRYVPLVE